MAKNHSTAYILTGAPVRLSFPQLTTGKPHKTTGKLKFGATLLIPKTDTATLGQFKALIQEVLKVHAPNGPIPQKLGIRDGDLPNGNGNVQPGFAGHWVVACTGNFPTALYNAAAAKTIDEKAFYAGCWCYAQVNAFWFDVDNSRGVSFGLAAVQFARDDDRLGGGAPAPGFAPIAGAATAAPGAAGTGDNLSDMFK